MAQRNFKAIKPLALQKFKELGPNRTLKKLHEVLLLLSVAAPGFGTLVAWCKQDKWHNQATEYDAEQFKKVQEAPQPELPASPEALAEKKQEVFNFRAELARAAHGIVKIVNEWSDGGGKPTIGVPKPSDARTLLEAAMSAIGKVEVLEGRVSDRQATEATLTVPKIRDNAKKAASPLLEQITALTKKHGIELDAPPEVH